MKMQTLAVWLALGAAHGAHAEMYRCQDAGGSVSFQQLPCAADQPQPAAPAGVRPVPATPATPAPQAARAVPAPAPAAAPLPVPAAAAGAADEPVRPTRRKREVLELTAQLERCRADVPGFAEKSAAVHVAWSRRHAAVLAEYDRQLAAKVRASRRGEATLPVSQCTDDWLRALEPLARMPDARFSTVEKTWQVFMGALMTGDRATALSCFAGRAGARWKERVEQMSDEDLRRIGASIRALKVQWGDDYDKEGLVADTQNRMVAVAFRNLNEEWKITDWGAKAAMMPAP